MSANDVPSEPPPSYQQATSSSTTSTRPRPGASTRTSHLEVPSIPADRRRSMEDEARPLPRGWVRSFDPTSQHQFFVETTKDPPRSIWIHPYDDDEYLSTLSSEERERIQEESNQRGNGHPPSKEDVMAAHTDEEDEGFSPSSPSRLGANELPPRPDGKDKRKDNRGFGRKFKDKLTGTTHEEREQQRRKRAEAEQKMYEQHIKVRQAMAEAARTGQPQLIGKDKDGKELYIEPPAGIGSGGAFGRPYGNPYSGGPGGGQYYNPYGPGGVYTTPNARYVRPPNPYNRPYGGGYGGGYGLPIGLGIGGGLLGGLLLGDALGGGFGGGF